MAMLVSSSVDPRASRRTHAGSARHNKSAGISPPSLPPAAHAASSGSAQSSDSKSAPSGASAARVNKND